MYGVEGVPARRNQESKGKKQNDISKIKDGESFCAGNDREY
jgi:hypothetical protein